eukprot:scaffold286628_cov32-Tisochrysis_lutea.AAC.2
MVGDGEPPGPAALRARPSLRAGARAGRRRGPCYARPLWRSPLELSLDCSPLLSLSVSLAPSSKAQ